MAKASKSWRYMTVHPNVKVKIDTEDYAFLSQHSWRITYGTTGRSRVVTSIRTDSGVKNITLGKFLMKPKKGLQVYPRRFQDGLDYRKSNLVVCTLSERQRLLPKKRTKTSSKYRGVSYLKASKKWRASIEVNGKTINLGNYQKEDHAALAYNEASEKYFGKNSYQNPVGRAKINRGD